MDENENVTVDYAALVKEAAIKGAVTAVASIVVTFGVTALIGAVQARRNKTVDTVADTNE